MIACEAPRHPLPAHAPGHARRTDRDRAPARPAGAALGALTATYGTRTMRQASTTSSTANGSRGSRRTARTSTRRDTWRRDRRRTRRPTRPQVDCRRGGRQGGVPRPGARAASQSRFDVLDAIGSEILARKDELGTLLAREEGKTLAEGIGEAARAAQIFKFFAGEALRLRRRGACLRCARASASRSSREPLGVVGADHALELPDRHSRLEDRAGARLRQLRGLQAGRAGAGDARWALAEIISRAGVPAGRVQPRDGPRQRDRRCAGRPPGIDADQLHRLGRRRPAHHRDAVARRGEGAARDGRQEPARGARRRRPGVAVDCACRAPSTRPASAARHRAG